MRIYLDTCSLQRPLDNKTQVRVRLEAEAVLGILSLCEAGTAELVSSEALTFETFGNPNPARREYALAALSKAKVFAKVSDEAERRARILSQPASDLSMRYILPWQSKLSPIASAHVMIDSSSTCGPFKVSASR